jgi:hypothetical protein
VAVRLVLVDPPVAHRLGNLLILSN